jgi:ribosomal protein S18 acetylase RimI-like enzyme
MSADGLVVRPADRDGVATMLSWAADEGWNPGLGDAEAFHRADPDGFLLGWLGDEPIAAVSLVRYGDAFGFLGLYIVRPEHRGLGHGLAMWRAALELAGDRVIGLDGVPAQQPNYARSGFILVRRNVRYEGRGGGDRPLGVTPIGDTDLDALAAYDRAIFPADRRPFLDGWLRPAGGAALAVVPDGSVRGYGVVRPCGIGSKIGPLFADTAGDAERLFEGLAAHAGDAPLFLDVPEPNDNAIRLAEAHGMHPVFETARMYLGEPPDEPVDRIFGVTTFELG